MSCLLIGKQDACQRSASHPSWNTASISFLSEFPTEYIVFLSKYTVNTLVVRKFDDL